MNEQVTSGASGTPANVPAQGQNPSQTTSDTQKVPAQGQQQPGQQPPKQEAAEERNNRVSKLKLKVDGKEIEEELPFELDADPEVVKYLTDQLQLAKMAQKRAQEASASRKQLEEIGTLLEAAKTDKKVFRRLAKDLGISEKELAAEILEEEIENSKKTPEQLELEKAQEELKKLRDDQKKLQEEREKEHFERLQQEAYVKYDKQISEALEKSVLPKSPYTIKKIAGYLRLGLDQGLNLEPADVLPLVEQEFRTELKEMFAVLPQDTIEELVGKDFFKAMKKKNLEKGKTVPEGINKIVETGVGKKKEEPKKPMKMSEFFRNLK